MSRPTFEQAKAAYVHRFTMEHAPTWAKRPLECGRYHAPQFSTDAEWYANSLFPGEEGHPGGRNYCYTTGATWPLGQWLEKPFDPIDCPDKGHKNGKCNRTRCPRRPATWFSLTENAYYCEPCAIEINKWVPAGLAKLMKQP